METSTSLKEILSLEVARLHEQAQIRPLNDQEVKKLEALTRAWKTYNATQEAPVELGGSNLTDEQLLDIARVVDVSE